MNQLPEAQFQKWLINQLRRLSVMQPGSTRSDCFKQARVGWGQYRCAHCQKLYGPKEIKADHIEPCIDPEKGFEDWNTLVKRMFWGECQALCKTCHQEKSNEENKIRRKIKKGARNVVDK